MAPKSETIEIPVIIEILTPDKQTLANQRDYWKERALEAIDLAQRLSENGDGLADKLAEQYTRAEGLQTLLDEVTSRMEWYRTMYYASGGDKINDLIAEHRLNTVG